MTAQKQEYERLHSRLKTSLASMSRREADIKEAEASITRDRQDMEKEASSREEGVEVSQRRLKEEFAHQCSLDRARLAESERQRRALEERVAEGERRYGDLDRQFMTYRSESSATPEASLRSKIAS